MDIPDLEEDFSRHRDEAISGALDLIFGRLWKQVNRLELQRSARLAVARECLEVAYAAVDLAYPPRQKAAVTPISMMCGSWEPDKEPERPALERWVTGYLGWLSSKERGTATVGARQETGSPAITPPSSRLSSRPVSPPVWPAEPTTVPVDLNETIPIAAESLAREQPDSQVDERLREELALRKQQKAAQDAVREQDEAERERLAALRSRMRGRTYAYDHRGQVVLVSRIDPQRLPRPMTPTVRVAESRGRRSGAGGLGGSGTATGSSGASGEPTPAVAASSKPKDKRRKGPSTTDYIERPRATGPSVLDKIQLEPGVSVKGADGAKSGPPRKSNPEDMTRAEFVAYAAKKNKASAAAAAMFPAASSGGGTARRSTGTPGSASAAPGAARAERNTSTGPGGRAAASAGAGSGDPAPAAEAQARAAHAGGASGARGGRAAEMRRRSGDVSGRGGAGRQGPGSLERGGRGAAPSARVPRERGLKGPLRRRTEDLPEWVQQGKLKPLSARGAAGWGAGGAGGKSKLPPVAAPASTAGFDPPPGMPITKPTLQSISSTLGRTDRLPRSRAEKPTCCPPRSRSSSPARQATDEAPPAAAADAAHS